jgi:hypothetical protein
MVIYQVSGQAPQTCFLGCGDELSKWSTATSAIANVNPNDPTALDQYWAALCSTEYSNLIQCWINTCPAAFAETDVTTWNNFEKDCSNNGHPILAGHGISSVITAGSSGSTGVITPPPPSDTQCDTQCTPLSTQIQTDYQNVLTNNNWSNFCTVSMNGFYQCLIQYCAATPVVAQGFNNAYQTFAGTCRAHGFSVAGSVDPGNTSGAEYFHKYSIITAIGITLISLFAIKFA